jgi:NADPH-dependent 2,4-dienoyl-CoA reductase/sulfur reductase-like enzyme
MEKLGIDVHTGETVKALAGKTGGSPVSRPTTALVPADIVVLGLGVRPNTGLAKEAGLPSATAPTRSSPTADAGASATTASGPPATACRDLHRITGEPVHIPLGTHANKQGRVAGVNIGGGYATFPGVIGTAVTKVCDLEVARTGCRSARPSGPGSPTSRVRSSRPTAPATSPAPSR